MYYIGIKQDLSKVIFRSKELPKEKEYPQFIYITGPYKTKSEAETVKERMRNYGKGVNNL